MLSDKIEQVALEGQKPSMAWIAWVGTEVAALEAQVAGLREYVREVSRGPHHTAIDAVKCPDLVEWVCRIIDGAGDLLYEHKDV